MEHANTDIQPNESYLEEDLIVTGAREHNLKNVNTVIPHNQLVVITGLSGSGKSSLAFDTIYAEGQRRYMDTFSSYARYMLGNLERPDVDKITGLNPVISIEQKSVNKNPRSTVGTITEIYDFLRLLFSRVADAYSYNTGEKMVKYTEQKLFELITTQYQGKTVDILSPLVKGRKGHYRELFVNISKQGFLKVRIDGQISEIRPRMQLDRYKIHDIELVIDRITISDKSKLRLSNALKTALKHGKGMMMVGDTETETVKSYSRLLMCPTTGISYPDPEPNTFSFNSPYGACPHCNGLGVVTEIDIEKIIPNPDLSIREGAIIPLGKYRSSWIFQQIDALGKRYNFSLDTPICDLSEEALNVILYGSSDILQFQNEATGIMSPVNSFDGIINFIRSQDTEEAGAAIKKWISQFTKEHTCPECQGHRLKKESLFFRIGDKNIADLSEMDLSELYKWIEHINLYLDEKRMQIASEIVREIKNRLKFMLDVGVDYLMLNRSSQTLSGGEAQRIRLATQIGSQLVNVLYILDEPSIGLHQRDNARLIQSLKDLRDMGNSVIVVEHDEDMMKNADYIIDIGPRAGIHGGHIVSEGTYKETLKANTLTGDYLSGRRKIAVPSVRRTGNGNTFSVFGATGNNLKNIDVHFPLGTFICVTGVSGSGKSTLINETVYPILSQNFYRSNTPPLPYSHNSGLEFIDKVIEIDQAPIGRSPRSNPATYIGIFEEIRKLYASLPEARLRNYKPGRFSFNVSGGRCETCKGAGVKTIEMHFLPNVFVQCDACNGKRYNRETLEIRYRGKSISDVLDMSIDEAVDFFENIPHIAEKIKAIQAVGLGYITLGQSSTTLSGGEAQRVKLASELIKRDTGSTFYILDEPTTGLHFEDINILLNVLNKLVDKGNTVVVIEHNMDVIKTADYIIDIGMEGGNKGGEVIATGTPEEVVAAGVGYTAQFLKNYL